MKISYNNIKAVVESNKSNINSLTGKVETNTYNISTLNQTASEIYATVEQQQTTIDTINGKVTQTQSDIASLKISYNNISSTVSSNTTSISNINNSLNNLSGQVTTNTTNISKISQKADSIISTVSSYGTTINNLTGQVENNTSYISTISQKADNIKLELTDGLSQTGIDIKNHKITINADDTNIVGNLNLYDKENGLTIYDDNNNKRVNISGKSIEDTTIQNNYTGEEKTANNSVSASSIYNTNVVFNYSIYLSKGVNIIKSFKITQDLYYSSTSVKPHQNNNGSLTLSCNGVQQNFKIYLAENIGYYYYYCNDYFKIFSEENKYATLTISVNTNNSLSSWSNRKNLYTYFNFIFEKFDTTCTHICNDGLYSMVTPRKFLKMDYGNFELSNCYNGIRVVDYCDDYKYSSSTGIEINAAKSDWEWGKPVWLSIFDYTPIYKFGTTETVQKKVTNMNETKYVFEIDPKKHRGLIIPNNINNSNDGNELYILLPKNRIYYESYSVPLTPGYTIRISSCLANKNIYVTPNSDGYHHGIIIDDNKDENYFTNLNSSNGHTDTYIFLGSEPDKNSSGLYIDRWLSIKDTQ